MSDHPACPNCVCIMMPVSEEKGPRPQRNVYSCDGCGSVFSEVPERRSAAFDRAMVLNFGADIVRH
jgi:hypothetical protein